MVALKPTENHGAESKSTAKTITKVIAAANSTNEAVAGADC